MLRYNIRPHSGFSTYGYVGLNYPLKGISSLLHFLCHYSETCIVLDEQKLIQQSFEPLYVTENEAAEKCKVMREEVEAAIIKRSKGNITFLFAIFYLFILSRNILHLVDFFVVFFSDAVISPLDELEWPEFTFLGTASSSPSKYRNISAILVRLR